VWGSESVGLKGFRGFKNPFCPRTWTAPQPSLSHSTALTHCKRLCDVFKTLAGRARAPTYLRQAALGGGGGGLKRERLVEAVVQAVHHEAGMRRVQVPQQPRCQPV
jgi:hypothetical protein